MAESSVLTEEIVLAKSGKKKYADVTKINAFAMGVERITSLKSFVNLEVVSLSLNKISSLEVFADCHALKELHLRKNNIEGIDELQHLSQLTNLHTLLLSDNPCTKLEGYRITAIRVLKSLRKLDSLQVTDQEKLARLEEEEEKIKSTAEEVVSSNSDDKFGTCNDQISSPPLSPTIVDKSPTTPTLADDGSLKTYSNTLLAAKLLLSDMNDSEVQQLQIWCAKDLIERKK
jgi:Leucine-rich repeat (LRR) protein